ncbi:MAG: ATP synthase F1 subunit gamma [Acidimicrobiaceae bacterium]|nr:ATP synthase F1 subunit gamma [Acidimicrobiaceae bacterium]
MAGGQERILRRRIKSVQSTKKITKAMELIAASRIVKAMARISSARPYYEELVGVVRDVATSSGLPKSIFLGEAPVADKKGLLAITADRTLCGAYNSSVLRATERQIQAFRQNGKGSFLVTVGRKANSYLRYREVPVEASFTEVTDRPTYDQARQIALPILQAYEAGELESVDIISNRFYSAGNQRLEITQLLPLDPEKFGSRENNQSLDFEIEPSPEAIIDPLLRMFVEETIFAILLEASAAEHAARQRAMKAASDNAEELIKTLSRIMNRARQDSITTEITEIVGGAEALGAGSKIIDESYLLTYSNRGPVDV